MQEKLLIPGIALLGGNGGFDFQEERPVHEFRHLHLRNDVRGKCRKPPVCREGIEGGFNEGGKFSNNFGRTPAVGRNYGTTRAQSFKDGKVKAFCKRRRDKTSCGGVERRQIFVRNC